MPQVYICPIFPQKPIYAGPAYIGIYIYARNPAHVEFYMDGFEKVYILVVFWKILHEIVWKISEKKNSMAPTARISPIRLEFHEKYVSVPVQCSLDSLASNSRTKGALSIDAMVGTVPFDLC